MNSVYGSPLPFLLILSDHHEWVWQLSKFPVWRGALSPRLLSAGTVGQRNRHQPKIANANAKPSTLAAGDDLREFLALYAYLEPYKWPISMVCSSRWPSGPFYQIFIIPLFISYVGTRPHYLSAVMERLRALTALASC